MKKICQKNNSTIFWKFVATGNEIKCCWIEVEFLRFPFGSMLGCRKIERFLLCLDTPLRVTGMLSTLAVFSNSFFRHINEVLSWYKHARWCLKDSKIKMILSNYHICLLAQNYGACNLSAEHLQCPEHNKLQHFNQKITNIFRSYLARTMK